MSKSALIYDGGGNVVGYVFCANDDDLAKQGHARMLEVAHDHPALQSPGEYEIVGDAVQEKV